MPITNPDAYPIDWHEISFVIRDANLWQCQECGVQCRRPDQPRFPKVPYDPPLRELTCSHYFHDYTSHEILIACMCAACHLRHDARDAWRIRRRRARWRQERAGQRQFRLTWRLL